MANTTRTTERIHRRGRCVLCFPHHSQWFQGYFLPDETTQLGLLGIEQRVDECVQCPDGGYQRFLVTVTNFEVTLMAPNITTKSIIRVLFCSLNKKAACMY